jgi:Fe-S-cluster containining protein
MCCNGVLFHGTRLESGDSIRTLSALGLKLKRKDGELQFLQPCPAYKNSCCGIYDKRPQRCRAFECRQLEGLHAGEFSEAEVWAKIHEAKNRTDRVRELFALLGDTRENKPFAKRYATIFTPPLDPSPESVALRAQLAEEMAALEEMLAADFRVETPA